MRGSLRASLPTKYLQVGVVVEYNIHDKQHHRRNLHKTLTKVKDLFNEVFQVKQICKIFIKVLTHCFEVAEADRRRGREHRILHGGR